jgi:hypothetical protein
VVCQPKASPTPLNRLRADDLRTATERAGEAQGVFTLTVPIGGAAKP